MKEFLIPFLMIFISITGNSTALIPALTSAMVEILENFYSKYSRNLTIIDFGGQKDLVNSIAMNLNYSVPISLMTGDENWTKDIINQAVLLFDNFKDLNRFNKKDLFHLDFLNPIRLLVYCENCRAKDLSRLDTVLVIPPYYYFVVVHKARKKIELFTFENLKNLKICHESQRLIKVNRFSSEKGKWLTYPVFPKKYKNFHGCIMPLLLIPHELLGSVFIDKKNETDLVVFGPVSNILIEFESKLNFKLDLKVCTTARCREEIVKLDKEYIYSVLMTLKLGDLNFFRFSLLNIESM